MGTDDRSACRKLRPQPGVGARGRQVDVEDRNSREKSDGLCIIGFPLARSIASGIFEGTWP